MRSQMGSVLLIGGLTVLAVAAILFFGVMITAPPRGILFYGSFGVAAAVALIIGLLAVNARLGRGAGAAASSQATMAITFGVAVGYLVTVLGATFLFAMFRGHDSDDSVFSGVLFVLTAVWFGIGIILYSRDLGAMSVQAQVTAINESGRSLAARMARVRTALDGIRGVGSDDRQALLELHRKLGILEGQWSHLRTGEQATADELARAGGLCAELESIVGGAGSGAPLGTTIESIRQALGRFNTMLPRGS